MKEMKYPVSIYDEPAEYTSFSGGMNTDRNDLGLLSNQMKFCENMHYENGNLHIRKGGKKFIEFECIDKLNNVQGIFLFSVRNTYIIVANNGKFYFGLYSPFNKIRITYLPISINESDLETDTSRISAGLTSYLTDDSPSQNHDGFMEIQGSSKFLIFQNKSHIEAIQYKNKLYITTGTRFVEISESYSGQLFASCVQPYKPNGIEYTNIGPNLLSFLPSLHINAVSTSAKTTIHAVIPLKQIDGSIKIKAIMSYSDGETAKDYRFKWERTEDGLTYTPCTFPIGGSTSEYTSAFKDNLSIGHTEFTVSKEIAQQYRYRCSFGVSFKTTYNTETQTSSFVEENGDYVIDKIDGYWFGQAQSIPYSEALYTELNESYMQIQTCKKIFGYGNKFVLYDDAYNSGNFWKTIIDNPAFISYRGGLNFKTDKDEQLTKVINFKGVIVCFAFNQMLGGNISVVSGNGDDYNDGTQNYSPFSRRIVNKEITTDNADSVQVTDNVIIFKYKQSIYTIEGSELNYEIVSVSEINTHVKQGNQFFKIPFYDNNCISEKNDSFYALYWKDSYSSSGEVLHPACRLKIYYKDVFQDNGRIYYPMLVDTGELFNADFIIYIEGKPYSSYSNKLISFNEEFYLDLDKKYTFSLVTRGYELNYPQFIKSIQSINISYAHDESSALELQVFIYNEAMYEILKNSKKQTDSNIAGDGSAIIKLDNLLVSYLLILPHLREDCMAATVKLVGETKADFVLSSFIFYYKTKSTPKMTPLEKYKRIIRKGERLIK